VVINLKDKEKKVFAQMIMFFFVIILCFGLLIIKTKSDDFKQDKLQKKFELYLKDNYSYIYDDLRILKSYRKNDTYYLKVVNKKNDNLYFTLSYKDNKIKSSYKTDYLEGKTLLSHYEKILNDELKKKNKNSEYSNINISFDVKLNECSSLIYKRLLNNKYNIPIYTINFEDNILFDSTSINSEIVNVSNYVSNIGFNPKYYNLTLNDQKNLTNTISVKFKSDIIDVKTLDVGTSIVNNDKKTLEKYSIEVKYLN